MAFTNYNKPKHNKMEYQDVKNQIKTTEPKELTEVQEPKELTEVHEPKELTEAPDASPNPPMLVYFVDKAKSVNLRTAPDINSSVLVVLKNGTFLEVAEWDSSNKWTKIKYKDKVGYMMSKYITVEHSISEE